MCLWEEGEGQGRPSGQIWGTLGAGRATNWGSREQARSHHPSMWVQSGWLSQPDLRRWEAHTRSTKPELSCWAPNRTPAILLHQQGPRMARSWPEDTHLEVDCCLLIIHLPVVSGEAGGGTLAPWAQTGGAGVVDGIFASICIARGDSLTTQA